MGDAQEMANQLDVVIDNYEPEPMVNQPSAMEDKPPKLKTGFDITPEKWFDMSKPAQRNFIYNETVNRNSQNVRFYGRERRKWDIMTPTERKNALAQVRTELERRLNYLLKKELKEEDN
jgi:hypothetical protein